MDLIIQRARHLISWMAVGAFCFMLLGYVAKVVPAIAVGIGLLVIFINLFGAYLFLFYPDLREEVGLGLAVEILAAVLLWM